MAESIIVSIDMTKVEHEAERMWRGEIPFNNEYLKELVEYSGIDDLGDVDFDFSLTCDRCGSVPVWTICPECKIRQSSDCSLCDGNGGFWECLKCDGDDGEPVEHL